MKLNQVFASFAIVMAFLAGSPSPKAAYADSGQGWPMYLGDVAHSGHTGTDSLISPETASTLTTRWSIAAGGAVFSEPIISGGLVYWGEFDGNEHATSIYGKLVWTTYLGQTTPPAQCKLDTLGVASSAAVASETIQGKRTTVVYVGGGNNQLYALNARNGAILWQVRLGSHVDGFLWDSPLVANGSVYIGEASVGDCPLVTGRLFKIDASTGTVTATFRTTAKDCIGNGIWGSPTLDQAAGTIYLTTGNPGSCGSPQPYGVAIVEVRASDLSVVGSWQVPKSQQGGDSDFGATPTLFSYKPSGKARVNMVGAVNKTGMYYAFRRDHLASGPVWQKYIGGLFGKPKYHGSDFAPSAWDGTTLYVAGRNTIIAGQKCNGGLRALNPANGAYLWQDCLPSPVLGGVIGTNGVLEVGSGDHIAIVRSSTGTILLDSEFPNAQFWGSASISEGTLYAGDMSGNLLALSPAGTF